MRIHLFLEDVKWRMEAIFCLFKTHFENSIAVSGCILHRVNGAVQNNLRVLSTPPNVNWSVICEPFASIIIMHLRCLLTSLRADQPGLFTVAIKSSWTPAFSKTSIGTSRRTSKRVTDFSSVYTITSNRQGTRGLWLKSYASFEITNKCSPTFHS